MDAKNIQIPTTIKDESSRRLIQELIKKLMELEDEVLLLKTKV